MPLKNINPTTTLAWKKLASHFEEMDTFSLKKHSMKILIEQIISQSLLMT